MSEIHRQGGRERGAILLVVAVFLAASIAALASLAAGRAVQAARGQQIMEAETRAFNSAYAQIHMAMNVVNTSAYSAENQNLVLRDAIAGVHGGTAADVGSVNRIAVPGADGPVYMYDDGRTRRLEKAGGVVSGYVSRSVQKKGYVGSIQAADPAIAWLDHVDDPRYGLIESTNVRVYRGRDYIRRLQRLKGTPVTDVDPGGLSDAYFVLEAAGRVGDTVRVVSALVRENEPFSSFVFFQNRATLGVSGAPRGLIHSNDKIAFYFPNGTYVDSVSAVNGFAYEAGATASNTSLKRANPKSNRIKLDAVDFADLKTKAALFTGDDGLDAEITMFADGRVRVEEYTPPRHAMVTRSRTYRKRVGHHYEMVTETKRVRVGYDRVREQVQVLDHMETVTEIVVQPVLVRTDYETRTRQKKVVDRVETVTKYRSETVAVGTRQVTKTRTEDVFSPVTVTKLRPVKKWVSYNDPGAGGGTSVGGGGAGDLGEWVVVQEPYETTEMRKTGTKQVTYTDTETIYETTSVPYQETVTHYKTVQETYQHAIPVYENQPVPVTKQVPVYTTQTKTTRVPIYADKAVTKRKRVADYVQVTETWEEEEYFAPVHVKTTEFNIESDGGGAGTMYIDGQIRALEGDLNGRLTIVANRSARITGNVRYVDDKGRSAMKNGLDHTQPYERNPDYTGQSVLGVIARDDILFTEHMPASAEVNGTLMAVNGRVGIDGFWADETSGELFKDSPQTRSNYLTNSRQAEVRAYDEHWSTKTNRFVKESLRRIGGLISNNRVMETYIKMGQDGTSTVEAGFKRGSMKFDINLIFNPPPNFVEVPRPVLTYFVPVFVVRNSDA